MFMASQRVICRHWPLTFTTSSPVIQAYIGLYNVRVYAKNTSNTTHTDYPEKGVGPVAAVSYL